MNRTAQACPRDAATLVTQRTQGLSVQQCCMCAGLWLPSPIAATAVGGLTRIPPEAVTGLRCPQDGLPLAAVHHRGVELDVCKTCGGVWLDYGELERVLQKSGAEPVQRRKSGGHDKRKSGMWVGDLAGDAIGGVLEFVFTALSGL